MRYSPFGLPCESSGRPLDPIAQSWWDAGFYVVGYIPPPKRQFKKFIQTLRREEDKRRIGRQIRRDHRP